MRCLLCIAFFRRQTKRPRLGQETRRMPRGTTLFRRRLPPSVGHICVMPCPDNGGRPSALICAAGAARSARLLGGECRNGSPAASHHPAALFTASPPFFPRHRIAYTLKLFRQWGYFIIQPRACQWLFCIKRTRKAAGLRKHMMSERSCIRKMCARRAALSGAVAFSYSAVCSKTVAFSDGVVLSDGVVFSDAVAFFSPAS